jgi:hypothetical protein
MIPAGTILIAYLAVAIPAPVRSVVPTENWSPVDNILTVLSADALLRTANEVQDEEEDNKDRLDRSESRRPSNRDDRNADRQPNRRDRVNPGEDARRDRRPDADRRPDGDRRSDASDSRDRDGAERGETGKPESDRPSRSEKPNSDKGPDARHDGSRPPAVGSHGEGQPPGFGFPMPFGMPPGFNFPRRESDKSGPPAFRSGPFAAGPGAGFQPPGRSPFGATPPQGFGPDQSSAHPTGGGLSRILFQLLDADRNGQLSVPEFQRLAEILEHAPGTPHDTRRAEADRRPGAGPGNPSGMQRRGSPGPDRPFMKHRGFPMMSPDQDGPKPPQQMERKPDREEEDRGRPEASQRRPESTRDDKPGRGPDQPSGDRRPIRPDLPSQSEIVLPQGAQPVEVQIPKISGNWI